MRVHKTQAGGAGVMMGTGEGGRGSGDEDEDDAADRAPAQDRRRDAEVIERRIRMSFNQCPICWMPLASDGRKEIDSKWADVSLTFKGKPAYSIKHPSEPRSVARHVYVFGVLSGIGARNLRNYDKCHYIHYSMFGNADAFLRFWTKHSATDMSGKRTKIGNAVVIDNLCNSLRQISPGPETDSDIRRIYENVCVENSIFCDAFGSEGVMYNLLRSRNLNHGKISDLVTKMKHEFFVGCRDCNASMTISDHARSLFRLIFFPSTYSGDRLSLLKRDKILKTFKKINMESIIHYITLSGVLYREDHIEDMYFRVEDKLHRDTWQMRYIFTWCLLQVLMCLWKFYETDPIIGHHKSYIFIAVADFYLSLLLFALHEGLRETTGSSCDVEFECFNFFYASHMPFYLRSTEFNLASVVLELNETPLSRQRFRAPDFSDGPAGMNKVKLQLKDISDKVFLFWTNHFKSVSSFVNDTQVGAQDPSIRAVARFFMPPANIQLRFQALLEGAPLNIQTFATAMSPPWYWYHFKYITMRRVSLLCKNYDHKCSRTYRPQGVRVWRNWYTLFNRSVRALGACAAPRNTADGVRALLCESRAFRGDFFH